MSAHLDFIKDNDQYVASFDKADLALLPSKQLIVGTH